MAITTTTQIAASAFTLPSCVFTNCCQPIIKHSYGAKSKAACNLIVDCIGDFKNHLQKRSKHYQ